MFLDNLSFSDLYRIVLVMRDDVAAFRHAEFGNTRFGSSPAKHEGDDAGHVGLERDHMRSLISLA